MFGIAMLIADLLLLEAMFHTKINIIRHRFHEIRRLGPQQLLSVAVHNVFVVFFVREARQLQL